MSDKDALIKLLDLAIGAMNTVGRINTLILEARAEGREVSMEDVDALVAESKQLREDWDSS